mgnify:CR=1 FL=1
MTRPDPGPAEQWAADEGFEVDFADCSVGPIHYVAAGPETAPLVLLLHGFPDFWYTWRDHIAPLAAEYRVVAPDLRGYNRSARPRGVSSYRLDRLRTDVYELIQQLGYGTASVVGPLQAWILWYILNSIGFSQIIRKALNVETTPT